MPFFLAVLAVVTFYAVSRSSSAPASSGGTGGPPAPSGGTGGPPAPSGGTGGPPAPSGGTGGPPAPSGDLSPSETYVDSNKVPWSLANPSPGVWTARVAEDPKGFPGYEKAWNTDVASIWQPTRSSRVELVNYIEGVLAAGTKLDISPDIEAGKQAGLDDANASIQAYKDSLFGYEVKPVTARFKPSASSAWRDAYEKEFQRQLYRWGYDIVGGFVKKAGG